MKPYGQFCPVAQALDVVGERWTLLVIRELLSGSCRFGEILNGVRRIPRSVLASRLDALEHAGLIRRNEGNGGVEYRPTEAARALEPVVLGLGLWARRWAHRDPREDELDATLLLWDMQRRVNGATTPGTLVNIRFEFLDGKPGFRRYWLKIESGRGEVCTKDPGIEETLVVTTTRRPLIDIWMGHRDFGSAIQGGDVQVEGPRDLVTAMPGWFRLNTFVELERNPGHRPE
jgi:DNA-binding HxlR family transcriptional regulator